MANIRKMQSISTALNGVTSRSVTIASNGPGSLLIMLAGVADPAASLSINDTAGQPWGEVSSLTSALDSVSLFYVISTTAAPVVVTATTSGGAQFMNILLDEFTGVDIYEPFSDLGQTQSATGTPTLNMTPGVDRCMLWGACNDSITGVGSGFTKGCDDGSSDWSEWKLLGDKTAGVAQAVNFTNGGASNYNLIAAALKPAPHPARTNSLRPYIFGPGNAR